MSGSGITPVNSGPLIIRTYLDGSPDNTFILGKYDYPISSNRVLITSTNGTVTTTDNLFISSLYASSFYGGAITASSMNVQLLSGNIYASTLIASTVSFSSFYASSVIMPYVSTNVLGASSMNVDAFSFSSMYGIASSLITCNTIIVNQALYVSTMNLNTMSISTMTGSTVNTSSLIASTFNTTITSTFIFRMNSLIRSTFDCGATYLSTNTISTTYLIGSTLQTNILNVNSTIYGSTFTYAQINYDSQSIVTLPSTIVASNIFGSTLFGANIIANVFAYSTLIMSTTTLPQIYASSMLFGLLTGSTLAVSLLSVPFLSYSTIYGSTLSYSTMFVTNMVLSSMTMNTINSNVTYVSTLVTSTINGTSQAVSSVNAINMYASTLFANRASTYQCIFLTTIGSTLFISTCVYSTLNGNILSTTTLVCTSGIYSSLSGQRATASAGIASSIFSNQLIGSNVIGSTLSINNGVISTMNSMYGYSVSGFISSISSNVVSNTVIISSLNVPAVTPSNFYISTAQIVSLQVSSINSLSLGSDTTLTNTWVGQRALSNLTTGTNNTAYGNASLMFNTSGSYNTVYGISSMVYNSIGSYNTAVGEQAGLLAGFNGSNNIYVGYGATPSNISVINEIVIGGASAGGTNVGNGSNSLTLGNSATTTNVFYGSVGVGTTSPGTALDVRGSYQQIGGNMSVYNSSAAYVSLWLYSDGTSGCGWFLNSSTRNTDGGTYTATLRNDYGLLRLQSSGGITNPTNGITILANSGNVGINSNNPTNVLDVLGTMNVSGTLTASNIYCSSQILVNGISVTKIVQSQWNNTIPGVLYFNGNVGIGTTSLQSNTALTIYGSAEYIGNLRIGNTLCSSGSFTANSIDTQGGMFSCGSLTTSAVNAYGINANTFTGNIQANRINNGILLTSPMKSIWSIPGDCLFTSIQTKYPYVVDQNGDYIIDYINNTYVVQTTGPLNVAFPIFIMTARYSDVLRLQSFQTFNSTLDWRPQGGKIYMYNVYTYINSNYNGWAFQSDRRMKNNICPLESSLNEIIHIRPVSFMMKNNDSYSVGYIAQEVQPIFPLLVVKSNVKNEEYDSPLLSLNYNGFIPYYVKAFQQQHHMIEEHNTLYNNMKHYLEELNIQFESYNEEIQVLYDVISKQTMEITQLEHDILWMMS